MGEEASQQAVSSDTMTREELVARATQLVPVLRERAYEAEGIRRVPDRNVQALKAAGLFKTIQASRFGGYQLDLHTHLDVVSEIARGCGSTGWCLGVMQAHSWLVALFPVQAQEETMVCIQIPSLRQSLPHEGRRKKSTAAFVSVSSGRLVLAVTMPTG